MTKVQGNAVKPTKPTKPENTKGRKTFAQVGNKNPEVYPFKETVPTGFDFKNHKTLKKVNFVTDELYYLHRAAEQDAKATTWRAQAAEAKAMGTSKDRGKAKRLIKLTEKMAELKKQLQEQGIDVEELLKGVA